ncbi:hypothetical protein [Castellaniella sp.]|uniref:hypothetical protein n=1 Tax=Castellaniella sp. TaxID=1955812 RepID=UPI002B0016F5|nr:hypothetical protein [Castellaniella sp.]
MRPRFSKPAGPAARILFGLRSISAVFYGVMLAFVLGNAALVYSLMSRYDAALDQSATLGSMRTLSQQLAVRAMRLADGGLLQTGQISKEIDAMDLALRALDQGGGRRGPRDFRIATGAGSSAAAQDTARLGGVARAPAGGHAGLLFLGGCRG